MWWQYLLVFVCSCAVDIVPFPLPPAFTIMIALQLAFKLNLWTVIFIGVAGSITGRYILTLYIPRIAARIFNPAKNEDVQYLGRKLKQKGWESQAAILVYSLMPMPTTPLFIAGGMARMRPYYIIPAFFVGKLISDTIAVLMGEYAAKHTQDFLSGMISWQTLVGLAVGFLLIAAILFVDWRTLLQHHKFSLKFQIWK